MRIIRPAHPAEIILTLIRSITSMPEFRVRILFEGEWYADIGYEVGCSVAIKPPISPSTVQMVSFILSDHLVLGIKRPPVG